MEHSPGAFVILLAAIFTNNILLSNFLGMCSFLAVSRRLETAAGLGAAVIFVTACTAALNYLLYNFVLVPLGLDRLTFIVFIAVIAAFVQFVEMFIERFSPALYQGLGIFLPLITVNCAILGASLFVVIRRYDLLQTVGFGVGAGMGWALAIVLMAGLRKKLGYGNIPGPFRGLPMVLLITGVMAMAFMGFSGMVRIQ